MKNKSHKTNIPKDIIIVGAGPGGLTAGMLLAHRGHKVTIYEKNACVGGRNQKLELDKYVFDTGPTFLMMRFILDYMFELTGRKSTDYLKFTMLDPMYTLHFADKEVPIYFDKKKMRATIAKYFPGDETGFDRFEKEERKRFEKLYPCLQKDYSSFSAFFRQTFINAIPVLGVGSSLYQNLSRYFKHEELRLAFTFQSKYLGMSPWQCPSGFTIIPYIEHQFGIEHVEGGLNQISEAMAKVITEEGGLIKLNSPVKRIVIKDGVAKGVELEDGTYDEADDIIINADFAHAMSHLINQDELDKYETKKLKKRNFSCSTFMLYLALDKVYDLPHHNIYFANDYHKNVDDIFVNKTLVEDTSFYLQNACITDKTLAPKGKSTFYILVPTANLSGSTNWKKVVSKYRDHIFELVKQKTGINDLEKHIVKEKVITPINWQDDYNVFYGATFNLSHQLTQMLYFRPHNEFEEIDHLYLVGGGTHPGSGLPTIYESGRITSDLLLKKWKEEPFAEKPLNK